MSGADSNVYCGLDGSSDFEAFFTAYFAVDHIKPKARGGTDDPENLVLACHSCNLYKWKFDCNSVEEGRQIIEQRKQIARKWYARFVLRQGTQACLKADSEPVQPGGQRPDGDSLSLPAAGMAGDVLQPAIEYDSAGMVTITVTIPKLKGLPFLVDPS